MRTEQYQWTADDGWTSGAPGGTLGESAQLVLVFGGIDALERGNCFSQVRDAYPKASIIGCTTAGEIHGTMVRDDTVTITAMSFDHTRVAVGSVGIETIDASYEAGRQLASAFDLDGLRHLFVMSEGMLVNGSELVRGLSSVLPESVTVTGGFAGDGNRLQQTHVWCNGAPKKASAVAFGLYGDRIRVGHATTGGWEAFGPERIVTKSTDNVLFELDGQPALGLYKKYLGEYADKLPASGLLFPLELHLGKQGYNVLRALLAVDEERGSITFAGGVPERTPVRLMIGRIERLIEAAEAAGKLCIEELGHNDPQLSIIVSCNGRRPVLKQRIEEEVEAAFEGLGGNSVLTGFYSYGEIGPAVSGGPPELHNQTMSITTFAETV